MDYRVFLMLNIKAEIFIILGKVLHMYVYIHFEYLNNKFLIAI